MAIEKNIIIKVQDTEVKDATISAQELGTSLDTTNSKSNLTVDVDATQVASTTVSLDEMGTSLDKASSSANKMSGSLRDVGSNGGAIAVLDRLTGGLATQTRDAFEATKLFNIGLKGTRTALIATGIGAFVVALGLVVAYWDDIVDFITQANEKLEEQNMLIEKRIEKIDSDLKLNKLVEASLKAQGKSTDSILKQRDELLKAKQLELLAEQQLLIVSRDKVLASALELSVGEKLYNLKQKFTGQEVSAFGIDKDEQATLDALDKSITDITSSLVELATQRATLAGEGVKEGGAGNEEKRKDEVNFLDDFLVAKQKELDIQLFAESQYQQSILDLEKKTGEEQVKIRRGTGKDLIAAQKAVADAENAIRNQNLNSIGSAIGIIASLGEESKGLQAASLIATNAVGIASNIINTNAANARLTLELGPLAPAAITANFIRMGVGIASSVAATAKGLRQLGKSGDTSGGAGGGSRPSAPSFNLVQGSATNQIAQSVQTGTQPTRAFVVSSDVTSQQSLDRRIEQGSTL